METENLFAFYVIKFTDDVSDDINLWIDLWYNNQRLFKESFFLRGDGGGGYP